jgi:hypothetical protein
MFSTQEFIRILSIEQNVIHMQTKELTQADTLIQPQPGGNCMNWVLGHLLDNQITVLELLGGESPISQSELAAYQRESAHLTADGPGVLPLEQLLAYQNTVHELVIARLGEMDEDDFAREIQHGGRPVTLGWRLLFLNFHYTYHLGQLEPLRQLAGRTEKVI